MSDTADDLLNELSNLNEATEEMEQKVTSATSKKASLDENSHKAASMDAVSVALEAAKTAHMAAEQSQHAADKAINLAHEQKTQIVELSDANIAWRQSLRSAAKDIKSARNAVSVMMSISITASLASVGALGWLLYSLNNQYEQLKGDVLDIITTENTLFTKNLTLKVDQLSSLIEALASDIQRLNQNPMASATNQQELKPSENASQSNAQPLIDLESETQPQLATDQQHNPPSVVTEGAQATHSGSDQFLPTLTDQKKQLAQIESLIEQVLSEQQKLQANALSKMAQLETLARQIKQPSGTTDSSTLNQSQINQLKSIVASAATQQSLLKEIQATLKSRPADSKSPKVEIPDLWPKQQSAFKKLSDQIYSMQQQQEVLIQKVDALEALNNEVLSQPRPYSYRSPDLPIKTLEGTP